MRLSEYAKRNGVSYRTARRWFDAGKIEGAYRVSSKVIIVPEQEESTQPSRNDIAVYARVSSHDQKDDLERQAQRLMDYAISNGYTVKKVVKEIASGMNPHRQKLAKLLKDSSVSKIIVENRDRLARMNADLIIAATPKDVIIVNQVEPEDNDVQDIIDFLTSVCARQYGRRSARNRANEKAKKLLSGDDNGC